MRAVQVSIIIPTFNRASYIGAALESIRAQTFTHWECWVVDDGSIDTTETIVQDYAKADARIHYVKRPETYPRGSNGSRNYGLSLSQGIYIAFCDDDDYWLPDKLEKQVAILNEHPEVGLVTGNIEFVNADGKRTGRVIYQTGNHGYVFEDLLYKNRLSMITPMLRKEVFEKIGVFNTAFTIYEDWELWRRVSYYYPFYALKDVLACVRKHENNTMNSIDASPYREYKRYQELTKTLLLWGVDRFTPEEKKLIERTEWKKYRQILSNYYPGIRSKLMFFLNLTANRFKDGLLFIRLMVKYGILKK